MSLGQRSSSQSALKLCAFQNCVQPITSCMVLFKFFLAEMIITTQRCVVCKNMLLGQRSRSQPALKFFAFQIHVQPITSSRMMGFANYLAKNDHHDKTICRYKNHVTRSEVKVKAGTSSLCIPESCPTHNFIPKTDGI